MVDVERDDPTPSAGCRASVWVDRLEATIEAHTMAAAQVREACTIPGTSVRTAWLCRDKPSMKEVLRAAGVPTAASAAVSSRGFGPRSSPNGRVPAHPQAAERRRARRARSGSTGRPSSTTRSGVFGGQGVESIAVEEFVEGHEGFYDTIAVDGHVAVDFVVALLPERPRGDAHPLDLAAVRLHEPDRLRAGLPASCARSAPAVIAALGIGTSATHMEWFFGPKGLRFSEIGCRPPGVGAWDLYSAGNDLDLYRAWADAIVHGLGQRAAVPAVRDRDRRAAARSRTATSPATPASTSCSSGTASGSSTRTCRRRARRRSRSRPGTWPTPTSGCGTPTTTRCAACSTTSAARCTSTPRRIVLLGPQRRPTLEGWPGRCRPARGPVATITAGWQEREPDDAELDALLDGPRGQPGACTGRWLDVLDRDPEYAAPERAELAAALAELQELYLLRLDYALRAVCAVQRRPAAAAGAGASRARTPRPRPASSTRRTCARVTAARGDVLRAAGGPHERPVIAEHRAEVSAGAGGCGGVGGRGRARRGAGRGPAPVRRRRRRRPAGDRSIAWSAGAMALTDRVVLFHDRRRDGPGHAEVSDSGLSLAPRRGAAAARAAPAALDDTPRMADLAPAVRARPGACLAGGRHAGSTSADGGWPPDPGHRRGRARDREAGA